MAVGAGRGILLNAFSPSAATRTVVGGQVRLRGVGSSLSSTFLDTDGDGMSKESSACMCRDMVGGHASNGVL